LANGKLHIRREVMRVDVERIRELKTALAEINRLDFDSIEWFEGGEKIEIVPEMIRFWEFTGLNNADFVECCLDNKWIK
jgi:hypothetical protein